MAEALTPSLFEDKSAKPLAERMRPMRLDDVAGQDHLLGPDGRLIRMLDAADGSGSLP